MPLLRQLSQEQTAPLRNEHVGYVFFQTFNLIPVLTAFENVELPLLLTKLNVQQPREHVMTALKLVGLEERVQASERGFQQDGRDGHT